MVVSPTTKNLLSETTVEKEPPKVTGTVRPATTTTTHATITLKVGISATTATTTITGDTRNLSESIAPEQGNMSTSIDATELSGTSSSSSYAVILATSTLPTDASRPTVPSQGLSSTITSELHLNVSEPNSEELQTDNVTFKENQIASDGRAIPLVGAKFGQNLSGTINCK